MIVSPFLCPTVLLLPIHGDGALCVGIRAGLQRSYDWIAGENILDIMELREWKQMLYTLWCVDPLSVVCPSPATRRCQSDIIIVKMYLSGMLIFFFVGRFTQLPPLCGD